MRLSGKHAAFAIGAVGLVSAVTGLLSWWVPSSAPWLNKHGFAAWPLATIFIILFAWAAYNWYSVVRQLESTHKTSELVQEDIRMFTTFKHAMPKESDILYWLRTRAESRSFRMSDIRPLSSFVSDWKSSNHHFVNEQLEEACQQFIEAGSEFLSYQALHSYWAPERLQNDPDDPVLYAYDYGPGSSERLIQEGLWGRAERVLEAHNNLYMLGSRLGL
jgi:hypothetical protein